MSGTIPPLPQYAFMAWCLVKAQGQLYLTFTHIRVMQPKIFTVQFWFLYLEPVYIRQALQLTEARFILVSTSPPQPHFSTLYVVTAASTF
jgi:hypothetical protein